MNFEQNFSSAIRVPLPHEVVLEKEKADRWIDEEQDSDIREIKRNLVTKITHVSFAEFKSETEKVLSDALETIADNHEKYAVLFDYKPHASKRWVYELCKDIYAKNPPLATAYFTPGWERASDHTRLKNLIEQGITTFLISDDAAYSGEQIMNRQIEPVCAFFKTQNIETPPKFVLVIPYVTQRFLKRVDDMREKYGCEITLHTRSLMPTLAEILSNTEQQVLQEKRNGALEIGEKDPVYLGATITYFDHRVADDHSFSAEVKTALGISIMRPYAQEGTDYFQKETKEFEAYKQTVISRDVD